MALDKVTTAVITDDSVTGAKIENNPTVAGNLTVDGNVIMATTKKIQQKGSFMQSSTHQALALGA